MTQNQGKEVVIPAGGMNLLGILNLPPETTGVIAFAHGTGSGRLSPRNSYVARLLQEAGLGTLLFDLLEESEETDRRKVFDIGLLAERLLAGSHWLQNRPGTRGLKIGYFGASTGAAASIQAAAREPEGISAIVSRGGRPDMAMDYLDKVKAPTLLIVGGEDRPVVAMNKEAFQMIKCVKSLAIVPGASHLFEETGALDKVAKLAVDWFLKYMSPKK
ncbi:MAG TPA: dienelactone hydrolase family protein [Syntrophales bacterium]|nr:dienelactone hydrolase family protein [Syntrophales bacterium]